MILAEIHLLPTKSGGRAGATPPRKFGCPLGFDGEYFDVLLDLSGSGPLGPGDTAQVPIEFLCPDLIVPRLIPGVEFTLWEGRVIGIGKVIRIGRSGRDS